MGDHPPVLYLGDHAAHVIAESLQGFRNTAFAAAMLRKKAHPLAIAAVVVRSEQLGRVADLCDPEILVRLKISPDKTAHHDRAMTQPLARRVYDAGYAGLRWWSTITGAWHTTALFTDRTDASRVTFATPRLVTPTSVEVVEAFDMLGIRQGLDAARKTGPP